MSDKLIVPSFLPCKPLTEEQLVYNKKCFEILQKIGFCEENIFIIDEILKCSPGTEEIKNHKNDIINYLNKLRQELEEIPKP